MPRRIVLALLLAATAIIAVGLSYFRRGSEAPQSQTDRALSYVKPEQCVRCHANVHRDYQHVGMARSFQSASAQMVAEEFGQGATFFHARSGRYYEAKVQDGKAWQRRYERDSSGRETSSFELEVTHRIGSGNHARSYLHRAASGELVQLPLTWYTQEKSWGLSPGYDTATPPDFTRVVDDSCLFCHNGYPREGELAEGIDCQRCHGPGSEHVNLASAGNTPKEKIHGSIVNPRRLSSERKMDICLQCHLETTSSELPQMLRRFDREPFSFRAGEALGAYMIHFDHPPKTGHDDKFEIVNQAYRLRQSACFRESDGKLTCTTCHNPHSVPRGSEAIAFNRTKCLQCHSDVDQKDHPELATADCASCHMPKRRAEDAVHVVMTDHWIQRKPPTRNLTATFAEKASSYSGPLVVSYPPDLSEDEREMYLGVASISGSSDRKRGIKLLEGVAARGGPPKAIAVLGEGYLAEGDVNAAIQSFRKAIEKEPSLSKAHYNLGRALEMAGRPDEARRSFESALTSKPNFPEAEYAMANLLASSGDRISAVRHYANAIRMRPTYAEAHNNLGNLYAADGRLEDALVALEQAVRINPAYPEAHNNLGRVLAMMTRLPEALEHCRRAVKLKPDYANALYNLAQLLHETGATDAALAEYRGLIALAPGMVEAHLGYGQALGDAGRIGAAIVEFREVLRLRPGHAEAQRNLEMAVQLQRGGGN